MVGASKEQIDNLVFDHSAADICAVFDLPARVEVYDNSHIQGAHAVGAMIVAGPEGFIKSQYRKFNIRGEDLTPGDDFGMMKEVLSRQRNINVSTFSNRFAAIHRFQNRKFTSSLLNPASNSEKVF